MLSGRDRRLAVCEAAFDTHSVRCPSISPMKGRAPNMSVRGVKSIKAAMSGDSKSVPRGDIIAILPKYSHDTGKAHMSATTEIPREDRT